ncbi:MAG: O-antigen ligase family protein [Bacteroidales bacterium]
MDTDADITRRTVHRWIYLASLCLIAVFLPSSRYMLSVSEIILAVNWVAEGSFRIKFIRLRSDRAAIAFILIYVLSVIGVIWSEDRGYALTHDLLHKLPTLFMPLIVATTALPGRKMTRVILLLFISSVLVVSFIGFFSRLLQPALSFREASPFIPGLYFGLMVIIAAFQLPLLVRAFTGNRQYFIASLVISAWLIFFLFHLRALSGVVSLAAALLCLTVILAARKGTLVKILLPLLFIVIAALTIRPMVGIYRQTHAEPHIDLSSLDSFTSRGNPYLHDTLNIIRENGNLVYLYIADEELREAWNKKSSLDYDRENLVGQELRATLFRYMSSLGLRKDSEGFKKLTDNDIAAVERGVTNHLNVDRPGFYVRAYEEMMSFYIYYKSSRQMTEWGSLTKRIDLWRASWEAFRERPLLGWGTGSIVKAVDYGLQKNGSMLSGMNMKPHNQYLYILLTLGVAGLIITVLLYAFFVFERKAHRSLMFILFLTVFLVNFLGNNSLESQPGQDLFVFFSMVYGYFYPTLKKEPGLIY